jgi:hypothetical protein
MPFGSQAVRKIKAAAVETRTAPAIVLRTAPGLDQPTVLRFELEPPKLRTGHHLDGACCPKLAPA